MVLPCGGGGQIGHFGKARPRLGGKDFVLQGRRPMSPLSEQAQSSHVPGVCSYQGGRPQRGDHVGRQVGYGNPTRPMSCLSLDTRGTPLCGQLTRHVPRSGARVSFSILGERRLQAILDAPGGRVSERRRGVWVNWAVSPSPKPDGKSPGHGGHLACTHFTHV